MKRYSPDAYMPSCTPFMVEDEEGEYVKIDELIEWITNGSSYAKEFWEEQINFAFEMERNHD